MTAEELIVQAVTGDPVLFAVLGTRLYPLELPASLSLDSDSKDLPAATYAMISNNSHTQVPVSHRRYQLTVFAARYAQAKLVSGEIERLFTGLQLGGIRLSAHVNSQDRKDPETGLYMIPVDVKITYMKEV